MSSMPVLVGLSFDTGESNVACRMGSLLEFVASAILAKNCPLFCWFFILALLSE